MLTETNYFLDGIAGFAPAETQLWKPGTQSRGQLGRLAAQQPAILASGKLGSPSGCTSACKQPSWQDGWPKPKKPGEVSQPISYLASVSNPDEINTHC